MKLKVKQNQLIVEIEGQTNWVEINKKIDLGSGDIVLFLEDNSFFKEPCNLICVSKKSTLKWIIEKKDYPENRFKISNLYTEGEKLFVYRYIGVEEEIDTQNGKIITSELIK